MTKIAAIAAILASFTLVAAGPTAGADAASGLQFPAPAGTHWQVASGYNTATHSEADGGDPYALDIVRTDAATGGTAVLAPVSGRIAYVGSSGSRCVGITDDAGNRLMMCHLNPAPGLDRGQEVVRGEQIGTVAEAGDAANNGLAHIHFAVNLSGDPRGYGSGASLPFAGALAIEGVELPAVTTANAYGGRTFISTNVPNRRPTVDAGVDVYVAPGGEVVLRANGADADGDALTYVWAQTGGPTVETFASGAELQFAAAVGDGAVLTFNVTAIDPGVRYSSDDIDVFVTTSPPPVVVDEGRILGGSLPAGGGFGALLFGGGTSEQLLAAVVDGGCTGSPRFWATDNGRFVSYISGAADFVNAPWYALFAEGIPLRTIVIGQCA